ncbi:hypothetical protein BDN67DRAFT_620629 [Paxillus ammoniavirescens]|nr:hypothetical protein BDN67DRAFT_620629 [Paxillus ammoniavirescens]
MASCGGMPTIDLEGRGSSLLGQYLMCTQSRTPRHLFLKLGQARRYRSSPSLWTPYFFTASCVVLHVPPTILSLIYGYLAESQWCRFGIHNTSVRYSVRFDAELRMSYKYPLAPASVARKGEGRQVFLLGDVCTNQAAVGGRPGGLMRFQCVGSRPKFGSPTPAGALGNVYLILIPGIQTIYNRHNLSPHVQTDYHRAVAEKRTEVKKVQVNQNQFDGMEI